MDINGIIGNFPLPPEAVADLKALNIKEQSIGDGISRFSGHDKGVPFRFFIAVEFNEAKSKIASYEVFDEIEMIEWSPDRYNHPTERVKFLPPELLRFNELTGEVRGKYAESYERFKKGLTAPGTPLEKWGVLSRVDVATLIANEIYSVEQLAACPRSKIEGRFPPSIVEGFERAILFVNGKQDRAGVEDKLTSQVLELQQANAKLLDRLAALESRSNGVQVHQEPKRGRGRPKKIVVEDGVIKDVD